jgi:hypothetical protein
MSKQLPPIDDDIFAALQEFAEPLVDDYNSTLRKVIALAREAKSKAGSPPGARPRFEGLLTEREDSPRRRGLPATARQATANGQKGPSKHKGTKTRAPRGSLLPESEYELPLLETLAQLGGSGPSATVIEKVGEKLDDRLTEVDREPIDSGYVRWKNRVQFVRLGLMKSGDMEHGSQRGIWALSDQGRKRVEAEGSL